MLAEKVVLVEGPSDEIVFQRLYRDAFGRTPGQDGIDVVSMRGLSLKRGLELCAVLDKVAVAVGDNDGADPAQLRRPLENWLADGRREVFFGSAEGGSTLEPQLLHANGDANLRAVLGIGASADLLMWMKREKTEGALRIAESTAAITPPMYKHDAAAFIHG